MLLEMLLGMASIWKHPESKYFTACFRDHNGRQRRITTKETSRKTAQKLADEFEKAARTKRTLKQAQAVLAETARRALRRKDRADQFPPVLKRLAERQGSGDRPIHDDLLPRQFAQICGVSWQSGG